MISTSVASLESTIESEVKILQSKFSELTESVKALESKNDRVGEIQDRLQQLKTSIGKHPAPAKNTGNSVSPTSHLYYHINSYLFRKGKREKEVGFDYTWDPRMHIRDTYRQKS